MESVRGLREQRGGKQRGSPSRTRRGGVGGGGGGGGGKGDKEQGVKDWDEEKREAVSNEGQLQTLERKLRESTL